MPVKNNNKKDNRFFKKEEYFNINKNFFQFYIN